MVKLTPEEQAARAKAYLDSIIHPMGKKMMERIEALISIVDEAGSDGIDRKRIEGKLFLKGILVARTTRTYLRSLIEVDALILVDKLYYTPDNYELHQWKRGMEDEVLRRKAEEEGVRISPNSTHTRASGVLSKKSLPGGER